MFAGYREALKHNNDADWMFQSSRHGEKSSARVGEIATSRRDAFKRAGLYERFRAD